MERLIVYFQGLTNNKSNIFFHSSRLNKYVLDYSAFYMQSVLIFKASAKRKNCKKNITRPNFALDRRTILWLCVPGFKRQVFKHVKTLSEQSKRMREQKKNKGRVLLAESACNSQNIQFGLVMK